MTREQAVEALKAASGKRLTEEAHINADAILCELLKTIGYSDVVEEWEKVRKWYS